VNAVEVATPFVPVCPVTVFVPFPKVPVAPVVGAVNVTVTPLTGFEPLSRTVAPSAAAKAVLIAALCGVPLVAAIDAGTPTVFVRLKSAGPEPPETVAITV
jgi:hypothetical protein